MDETVVVRLVRDDGAELVVDGSDWGALTIDGAATPGYEIFSEKRAVGDGSIITGKRVNARDLTITANVIDTAYNDILRNQALAFFSPKRQYKIYLSYMGRSFWIDGSLSAFSCPNQYIYNPQEFTALFFCPNTYWNSLDDFGQDIASESPRWGFPYMDNPDYGVLVSLYNFSRQVVFDYDGDVPTAFTAELTADATVVNPQLNKDGYFVKILDTMQAGDRIVIDFGVQKVGITKNGENIINKVDRASNFTDILMEPGANTISYQAQSGDNNLHVVLRYHKKYLGV